MMLNTARKKSLGDSWVTYVEVGDEELDNVEVNYDVSPAEPDVNWGGGLDILSVIHNGEDVMDRMTTRQVEDLAERTDEYITSYYCEDHRY